jgi:hypothetical protein
VRGPAADDRRLQIPLQLGGRAAGALSLRIGIHKREYAYELVRPEVSLRAPVVVAAPPQPTGAAAPEDDERKQEEVGEVEWAGGGGGSSRRVAFDMASKG